MGRYPRQLTEDVRDGKCDPHSKSLYLKARPPGFKLHSYYADFSSYPIPGWHVLVSRGSTRQGNELLRQLHVGMASSSALWNLTNLLAPALGRLSFSFAGRTSPLERNAEITYCANHVQTHSPKWVADYEHIASLTGYYDPGVESRWLGRRLQENGCRALFCWSNKALENSRRVLGNELPIDKCHVVYPAAGSAPSSRGARDFDGTVRVCHITTHRSSHLENLSNFYVKGTRDVLLLLKLMSRVAPKLVRKMSITIRAWSPQSYIAKLRSLGVKIETIDQPLTRADTLSHLANSDISLMPCHATPTMAFVEAMSRSLPVISNDIWANREYLLDGKTGFLVAPPSGVQYVNSHMTPKWYRPGFAQSLKASVDSDYLMRHIRILSYIIEDENALSSLKSKTSQCFLNSPFDINVRNRELGRLLDQALN